MITSHSTSRAVLRSVPSPPVSIGSLLSALGVEFPEVSTQTLGATWERAYALEERSAGSADVSLERVMLAVRGRLEKLRRSAYEAVPACDPGYRVPAEGPHAEGFGRAQVPCTYCRHPLPPESFVYWSARGLLLSAVCPDCHRQSTLRTATWRRLSTPAEATGGPRGVTWG